MKKQSAVGKRAIWMGCDALAIVTPHTKEKTLMELELWSDVILGWDGNEVSAALVLTFEVLNQFN